MVMMALMFREKSIELAREVKKRLCLYDKNDEDYHDHAAIQHAWEEIGEVLGVNYDLAKKRWQNLRSSYTRALATTKPFYLEPYIKFLDPHLTRNRPPGEIASPAPPASVPDPFEEEQSESDCSIQLASPGRSPTSSQGYLQFVDTGDRLDEEQPAKKRKKSSKFSNESSDWHDLAKSTPSLTRKGKASSSNSIAHPKDPDLEYLKGLLPQIQQLEKRNKRQYFQKISNLLFTMLDEQDDADILLEEREAKPVI